MAISDQARQELQQKLDEVLGPKNAWALMEQVSGRDLGDLATKVDLDHLAAITKRDIEGLDRRMDERFKGIEGRMDERFKGLEGRMDERFIRVEGVLGAQIDAVGHRLEARLGQELGKVYKELAAHTRTIAFACVASVMSSTAVALGSARL